jgi:hypothetical protein
MITSGEQHILLPSSRERYPHPPPDYVRPGRDRRAAAAATTVRCSPTAVPGVSTTVPPISGAGRRRRSPSVSCRGGALLDCRRARQAATARAESEARWHESTAESERSTFERVAPETDRCCPRPSTLLSKQSDQCACATAEGSGAVFMADAVHARANAEFRRIFHVASSPCPSNGLLASSARGRRDAACRSRRTDGGRFAIERNRAAAAAENGTVLPLRPRRRPQSRGGGRRH